MLYTSHTVDGVERAEPATEVYVLQTTRFLSELRVGTKFKFPHSTHPCVVDEQGDATTKYTVIGTGYVRRRNSRVLVHVIQGA